MRNGLLGALLVLGTGAGSALAQTASPGSPPLIPQAQPMWSSSDGGSSSGEWSGREDRGKATVWANAEYLLWWVRNGPLPQSFVLTGNPNTDNPSALNAGGRTVGGASAVDYGTLSGVRVSLGGWLDADRSLGIEGSGFLLPQQKKTFRATSDASGNPVRGFRYFDPPDANGVLVEDVFQASIPPGNPFGIGPFSGSVALVSQLRLWGTEVNAVANLANNGNLRLQALAGFRYADLSESLNILLQSTALDGGTLTFLGDSFSAPSAITTTDSFQTRNQFYGGQLGLRGEYCLGNFLIGATAKVALGSNHEVVQVMGNSTLIPATGPIVSVPVGQFAGPSNIGRRTRDEFAVIPEVEVKLGYQITSWLSAYVGYDFLYWSQVVRPGRQVDLIVDDAANPVNGAFVPGSTHTAFPRPLFDRTDFWAQGLTFGIELRY